ncbi:MAG: 16S rRNA (guanine(966)-N(2))-methyltransferase RsmD [Ruminococcus sp.]|nr:16S rRNA (guanine(966)-N(2))-methyltransferase RsmD [Ruminococcus sp.]
MRVITGTAKGRRLETLSGEEVRPTTDKIKEAVFSIIQFHIQGRRFLDLFAGSGQMGIEALSRGAAEAVFVDNRKQAVEIVRKNLNTTKLADNAKVLNTDSIGFLSMKSGEFDIAFLDPPYNKGILQKALELLPQVMRKSGVILCENPVDEQLPEQLGDFILDRQYRYGKIKITTYKHKEFIEV